MPDAREIVNKALDGDENPSTYVDWLGKKTDMGEAGQVRFGFHVHSTDEEVLKLNAAEAGITTDDAFWKAISNDSAWLEQNAAIVARKFGLYIQGEGHSEDGAYVSSAWITAGLPQEKQVEIAKKIVALDGEMPSTTSGSYWTFFPGSETELYRDVSDLGRQLLDITVEFTGTDALAEWLKLNVVESVNPTGVTYEETDADELEHAGVVLHFGDNAWGDCATHGEPYLIKLNGKPVGWFQLTSGYELNVIEILPAYQKQGIGSEIVRQLYGDKPDAGSFTATPASHAGAALLRKFGVEPSEIYENVDDPVIQQLLDKVSPEPCFACSADLTQPRTVVRTYFSRRDGDPELHLEGHYDPKEGYFEADDSYTDSLSQLSYYDLPADCDTCKQCGKSTAKSGSVRNESIEAGIDDPETVVKSYQKKYFKLFYGRKFGEGAFVGVYDSIESALQAAKERKLRARARNVWIVEETPGTGDNYQQWPSGETVVVGSAPTGIIYDVVKGYKTAPHAVSENIDEPDLNPQHYVDQIHDLAQITHEIQNYGMFVSKVHPWGRWVVLSGGAYWATLHGRDDEEPLKADFFQAKLDEFMKKLGITQYHIKIGQTGTNNEHVWYQLGIPKAQLDHESWHPFVHPESNTDIAKWLPESTDPDDPSVNVDRHITAMDPEKILVSLGFHEQLPSWKCSDPDYKWWEKFDQKTGYKWTVMRKSEDAPHIMEVSILRMEHLPERPFSEWKQVGGFKTHVGNLAANIKKAQRMKWYTPGDDRTWHKNVQKLQTQNESLDPDAPLQENAENVVNWTEFLATAVEAGALTRKDAIKYQQRQNPQANEQIYALFIEMDEASQNNDNENTMGACLQKIGNLVRVTNMRYGSAIKDVMRDLPVDESDEGDPEKYVKSQPIEVLARISVDRTGNSERFDAAAWFEQATLEQMVELAKGSDRFPGFHRCRAANAVARFFASSTLNLFFRDNIDEPFEVYISEEDAKRWIEHNRPDWYPYLWPDDSQLKEGVDDPSPQFMQDTFDVPTILKRMGYEQHSPASPWSKVFNRMPVGLDYMIEVQRRGLGGEQNEADVVYDTTLYHYPVSPNVKREWSPIAHRYKRNNKQLEPMLKALEARIKANNLRGIVGDPDAAANPEFDDFVAEGLPPEDAPERYIKTAHVPVMATIKSDTDAEDVTFDASGWFEQASVDDLIYLSRSDFRDSPAAERVARFFTNTELREYFATHPHSFEVYVNVDDAKRWVEHYRPDWYKRLWNIRTESVDDPDDPSTTIAAHTQDLVADPDEPVKLNQHPHGEAEAELEVLGFKPSWIAGKNTIYGEPEIPNFWSKAYRGPGSSKVLFLKIIPDKAGAVVSVRTRSMSVPVALKPRSMAHIVTIIKDVDAAVQRAADNNLTKEQEIDAIVTVLDHHRQWCHPS